MIVAAGDVWKRSSGLHMLRVMFPDKEIVTVMGNHEAYRSDINKVKAGMRETAEELGIHLLENDEVVIDDVRFIGACGWSDFNLYGPENRSECMLEAQQRLNDFRLIRNGEWNFSPQDSVDLHKVSVKFIKDRLNVPFAGATVVVTHHAPSYQSVVPRFQNDLLSACFASRLDHLMNGENVELWVHGHMHDSLDYMINGTRVMVNPRGYCRNGHDENENFNPALIIEVAKGLVEIVPQSDLQIDEDPLPKISASMLDDAILAINSLEQVEYGQIGMKYVDLWLLEPELRNHVREIVISNEAVFQNGVEHYGAILPIVTYQIKWLVEELIKRASEYDQDSRRGFKI